MIEPIRLLAFAFAGADLLFEIDREGIILFMTGATSGISRKGDLVGSRAAELFVPREQARFAIVVHGLSPGQRAGPLPMTLASGETATLSMCFLPQSDRISCTLVQPGKRSMLPGGQDTETGLADREAFLSAAAESAGGPSSVALVNVPNLLEICTRLSPPDAAQLMAGIGAKVSAIGALIAARLSQTRFGVITDDPDAARGLAGTIQGAVRERGLESPPVEEVFLSLKGPNLSPEQNVLALRHVVGRFVEGKIKTLPTADLAEVFDKMMDETLARAQAFNATVAEGCFDLAFEPIMDLKTGTIAHYEALTRFHPDQSPGDMIRFAEELGLTDAFDMAVALKVFDVLERSPGSEAAVAVNISGRTIANPSAFGMLAGLFAKKHNFAKRVLIELTESAEMPDIAAADHAIQVLRRMGYRVGIDDFGAGAASLQYLHGFTVDFIKIDGGVVQRLGKSQREDTLLKSVLSTCAELGIATIAEWIDSPERLQRCRDMGFHLGQGRHFGSSIPALPKPAAQSDLRGRRAQVQSRRT